MFVFCDEVYHLLTDAGWYQGRVVDTQHYRQHALQLELPWLPAAEAFLQEFGGLYCFFVRQDHSISRVFFDATRAAAFPDLPQLLREYSPRVPQQTLCVVGQAYTDPLCLLMDAEGTLYGAFAGGFYRIAASGRAGVEAVILDLLFEEVLVPAQ
ncbi:SUKH-3 domain-containing protein [Hymenobacter sp. BT186]|uniref:SUKH-3 domain-containing protein n=1 Tax=Hymenobacter telluris TaxID=2816474 RepID=A0A939JFD7_9BACT|nr:SUKH-3 domain-containing protein [Hymenobacter telluris]MBO0360312.1 SUKH-3 domain-containing protein [Hymenobacter telluris]MBW3376339.1 SUKH-3 domain-containing protein [Hymenobacter norwichensis]